MKEILKALAKFQAEITPITKEAANPFFKSKYASLDHIQEHIKPALIKSGLVVIQGNIANDSGLFVESKVCHVDSGEYITSLFPVVVSKQDAQSYGSAVSYAKRYSLSGLLNLTIQDSDDDGNAAGNTSQNISAKQAQAAPKVETKDPEKWLNVLDKENNITSEWENVVKAIKGGKITSVSDVKKFYKVSADVSAKIEELLKK